MPPPGLRTNFRDPNTTVFPLNSTRRERDYPLTPQLGSYNL
jgi:hypothetical protein